MKELKVVYKFIKYLCIILCTVICFVILFNYFCDPYCVFGKKGKKIDIDSNMIDQYYIPLKLSRRYKYDYAVFGGSTFKLLKLDYTDNSIANLAIPRLKIKDLGSMIKAWYEIHPETRKILLPIDFIAIGSQQASNIAPYTGKKLNFAELYKLYLSPQTLKYSIQNILVDSKKHDTLITTTINQYGKTSTTFDKFKSRTDKYYGEIFDYLKDKDFICFTPPYPAIEQIYLNSQYGFDSIEYIKKYAVEKCSKVYDFYIINKYTALPLKDSFYLYSDPNHPRPTFGFLIYNIFFDKPNADKEIFTLLTKDNVDSELKKQQQQWLEWKNANQKEYQDFINEAIAPIELHYSIEQVPLEFRNFFK